MENQWCSKAGEKLQKSKRKISVKGRLLLFRDVVNVFLEEVSSVGNPVMLGVARPCLGGPSMLRS